MGYGLSDGCNKIICKLLHIRDYYRLFTKNKDNVKADSNDRNGYVTNMNASRIIFTEWVR